MIYNFSTELSFESKPNTQVIGFKNEAMHFYINNDHIIINHSTEFGDSYNFKTLLVTVDNVDTDHTYMQSVLEHHLPDLIQTFNLWLAKAFNDFGTDQLRSFRFKARDIDPKTGHKVITSATLSEPQFIESLSVEHFYTRIINHASRQAG